MKICKQCQSTFEVTDKDRIFYEKVSPVIAGGKYLIPEPTLCPDCRQQRRLAWRNERYLSWTICGGTGEKILSVFSSESPYKVYKNDYWWSDAWDPMQYGRDFDFSTPFFEQFDALLKEVPQLARSAINNLNCDYVNQCGSCKNCYLIFEADGNENCFYSESIFNSNDSMGCTMLNKSQLSFDCIDVSHSYQLIGSQNSQNCSSSTFLKNCIGVKNSFGCMNLINKEYCFFNEQLSKDEFELKISTINLGSWGTYQSFKKKFQEFALKFPHKAIIGSNNENSTGNYLTNTRNCKSCYDLFESEDCAHIGYGRNLKNVYDMNVWGEGVEFCYEVHEIGIGARNVIFSDQVFEGIQDLMYSKLCTKGSQNLFGCVGLRHKEYCILNKQYSKEEYEELLPKIIKHMRQTEEWGEFFPAKMSPFEYNRTIAQEYFPLNEGQVLERGWKWENRKTKIEGVTKSIPGSKLPDLIQNVPDDVLNWAIECEITGKPFKIIPQELTYYRKQNLPLPRRHPDQRYFERMKLRNPRQFWERKCAKCSKDIQTTYSPERPEIVYCEECYLKEIY